MFGIPSLFFADYLKCTYCTECTVCMFGNRQARLDENISKTKDHKFAFHPAEGQTTRLQAFSFNSHAHSRIPSPSFSFNYLLMDYPPSPVLLQKGDSSRTPLFLLHDAGGTIFNYFKLGNVGRPIYAISNPWIKAETKWEGGAMRFVHEYIKLIKSVVSSGEILVGGRSSINHPLSSIYLCIRPLLLIHSLTKEYHRLVPRRPTRHRHRPRPSLQPALQTLRRWRRHDRHPLPLLGTR